ncbi:hypothetical protein FSP39_017578 [Pinctada imbricata]|uniref:Methyltransferase FkbM domain-containing protein n=1 Tax=Pinctada imbricata TaxID=66713 RepID=A0AA88XNW1_PINIB|nr:hypothetical protein FSP39_017578 [Pinctada imbricata]
MKNDTDFILNKVQGAVGNVPIYIHDPGHDYISSQVNASHNFEPHIFETIYSCLKENGDMNLIDVGANIGIISLQAAVLGREVISIDAAKSNIQHICASAHENNAGGRIRLIHNAVSDIHTSVSFVMGNDGEFGASFMDDKNLRQDKIRMSGVKFDTQNLVTVDTVLLDDLLYLPNIYDFKTVFIKLDIEGSEHKVLLGARKLFQKLSVRGVLMEWRWHVTRPVSKSIILTFMEEFGFEPYAIAKPIGSKLDGKTMNNSDVIWLPTQ